MDKFFAQKKVRKIVAVAIITALLVPSLVFLSAPKPAEAQLGSLAGAAAGCLGGLLNIGNIFSSFTGSFSFSGGALVPVNDKANAPHHKATDKATTYQKGKEGCLDNLAWAAAKYLIERLGQQLIGWINGGFEGNPPFISDPGGFFLGIADSAAANFIFGDNFEFLCSARGAALYKSLMMPQIKIGLFYQHFGSYRTNQTCGLTDIIDNLANAPSYLAGNRHAASGGWGQWFAITRVPTNNIYGSNLQAKIELKSRVAGATAINKQVADWNNGFKSMTKTLTDGMSNVIETPGNFIKDQLYTQLGSNRRALEVADELSEVITAALGALVNTLAREGLSGITGSNSPTSYRRAIANRTLTSLVPNDTEGVPDQDNQLGTAVDTYTDLVDNAVQPGDVAVQTAKVQLYGNVLASQGCTEGDQTADLAVDGSTYTIANNSCGSRWWKLVLNQPEFLDEIRVYARDTGDFGNLEESAIPVSIRLFDTDPPGATPLYTAIPINLETQSIILPEIVRTTKTKVVYIPSSVKMREIEFYRHLKPQVDASNVPTSVRAEIAAAGFNPVAGLPGGATWVTATYYPTWDEPQTAPSNDVRVLVKDTGTTLYVPLCGGAVTSNCYNASPLEYILVPEEYPRSYQIEYTISAGGFRSATSTRNITVLPPTPVPTP